MLLNRHLIKKINKQHNKNQLALESSLIEIGLIEISLAGLLYIKIASLLRWTTQQQEEKKIFSWRMSFLTGKKSEFCRVCGESSSAGKLDKKCNQLIANGNLKS